MDKANRDYPGVVYDCATHPWSLNETAQHGHEAACFAKQSIAW